MCVRRKVAFTEISKSAAKTETKVPLSLQCGVKEELKLLDVFPLQLSVKPNRLPLEPLATLLHPKVRAEGKPKTDHVPEAKTIDGIEPESLLD